MAAGLKEQVQFDPLWQQVGNFAEDLSCFQDFDCMEKEQEDMVWQ
jgi:hypothetical protein